jgi:hypothetical protein
MYQVARLVEWTQRERRKPGEGRSEDLSASYEQMY